MLKSRLQAGYCSLLGKLVPMLVESFPYTQTPVVVSRTRNAYGVGKTHIDKERHNCID